MKYQKRTIFLLLFFFISFYCKPQLKTDSLLNLYTTSKVDSIKFKAIDDYIWEYMYSNPDTAFLIAKNIYHNNINSSYKKGVSLLLRTIGASFVIRGENQKGLFFYKLSRQISEVIKDDEGIAAALNGLGIIYSRQSDYSMAIEQYLESLASYERLKDIDGMSIAYNNIGLNYERQQQYEKAMEFYKKCLELKLKIGKPLSIAQVKINIGNVCSNLKLYDKALENYNEALQFQKNLNNTLVEATLNSSIGVVYMDQKKYDLAVNYLMKALVLRVKMNDKYGAIDIRNNLAIINNEQKNYSKAIEYATEAYEAANETQNLEMIKETSKTLSVAYDNTGNTKDAFKYYKIYNIYKDSVYNKENYEKSIQAELKYKYSKQTERNKLKQEKIDLEHEEASKRQKIIRNVFVAGFVFLLLLAFLIYRNLKQKQKVNTKLQRAYTQVEEKSNLLEVKNKEITDSIKYAKRLQEAILPSNEFIHSLFPNSFVFYKPKDIVSGDFYWFEKWGEKKLFAAVDCTGHGVPGAFMSIVGYNVLNQSVNESGLWKPNLILNALNKGITKTLKQTVEESTVKDGMDIALCAYDEKTKILEYAGAYNSLWLLRNNAIQEINADKMPIGVFLGEDFKPFTNKEIQLKENDLLYIFTDGYADQFGGPKGKKFKYKKLQELLLSIHHLDMDEQQQRISLTTDEWRGDLEQVDDMLIIGIKI